MSSGRRIADTFNDKDMTREIRKAKTLELVDGYIEVSGIWSYDLDRAIRMLRCSHKVEQAFRSVMDDPFDRTKLVRAAILLEKNLEVSAFKGYVDAGEFQSYNAPLVVAQVDGTVSETEDYHSFVHNCLMEKLWRPSEIAVKL